MEGFDHITPSSRLFSLCRRIADINIATQDAGTPAFLRDMEDEAIAIIRNHPQTRHSVNATLSSMSRRVVAAMPQISPGHMTLHHTRWRHLFTRMEPDDLALWASRGLGLIGHQLVVSDCLAYDIPDPVRADAFAHVLAREIGAKEIAVNDEDNSFIFSSEICAMRGPRIAPYMRAQIAAFPDEADFVATTLTMVTIDQNDDYHRMLLMYLAGTPPSLFQMKHAKSEECRRFIRQIQSHHGRLAMHAVVGTLETFLSDPATLTRSWRSS
ncbi:hypothetical protein ACOI1H_22770 [Loktanella sp. DJP18]|uniref:hypothetical protein n=1 Tax=Loktanella sp. DJP18 TaxID=3409788 RepID=UPI003BB4E1C2